MASAVEKYLLKTPGNGISETLNSKMSLIALALKNLCLWCEFQSCQLFIISLPLKNFLTALILVKDLFKNIITYFRDWPVVDRVCPILPSSNLQTRKSHLNFILHYFPHLYVLSMTVLTWWVAPPKMFCNWYRIYWSRNQLWQVRHVDIYFLAATIICSPSTLNLKKIWTINTLDLLYQIYIWILQFMVQTFLHSTCGHFCFFLV